jgi:hypothetical protein
VQHFPTALRREQAQFELLPDEGSPGGGELVLPHAPQAFDLGRFQNPVPLASGLRSFDAVRRVVFDRLDPVPTENAVLVAGVDVVGGS